MIRLYSAPVCPFAQRTRALLMHLAIEFETYKVDLEARDAKFLALTPTGKVPLLVDGKRTLWESAVINDYLARTRGFADAYDDDPYVEARQRLWMAHWDTEIVPAHMRALRKPDSFDGDARKSLVAHLQEFAKTLHASDARVGNLMSFHCAPFWARMCWLRDRSPIAGLIDEFIVIKRWLDAAVAQPAIQATLPDREATIQRYMERFVGQA